ncbi:MAG: peptidylprolyl isomerase [Kiritimatiellaeota bacterium]|nr:peptidylprolyl isomerase [Kiritimatiellota bacterium]
MKNYTGWRRRFLMGCAGLMTLVLLLPACGRKNPAPAAGRVDLSQATGIFNAAASSPFNPATLVVTVNGRKITHGDIQAEMQKTRGWTGKVIPAQQAVNNLILRILLQQAAEKEKIAISSQALASAVDSVRKQIPTNTTLAAALQSHGMTEQEFRASVISELQVAKLIELRVPTVLPVTDADIAQFVKDNPSLMQVPEVVTVRHILVATPPGGNPATAKTQQARAAKIRQQLLQGGKFETVAAALSDDPDKARGGLLPAFARGQVADKAFEAAAFSQKPGEIGPVIQTQWGYQILQVQERRAARTLKIEEVKDRLRQIVVQQKRQKALQAYVDSLRSQAKIVFTPAAK